MANPKGGRVDPKEVAQLRKDWQICLPNKLPRAFIAYDQSDQQTERVVTTYMQGPHLAEFLQEVAAAEKAGKKYSLIVYPALDRQHIGRVVADEPAFQLLIQVHTDSTKENANCFRLLWEPNPVFPANPNQSVDSGEDAIPAAGAYLFVLSWLETKFDELGAVFDTTAMLLGRRVKSYRFQEQESKDIIAALRNVSDPRLTIHLGKGITVPSHPVPFRPVVEAGTAQNVKLVQGGGNAFFDFSRVCPPYCPG